MAHPSIDLDRLLKLRSLVDRFDEMALAKCWRWSTKAQLGKRASREFSPVCAHHAFPVLANETMPDLSERGGLGKAHQLFGEQLPILRDELNEALAA